MNRGKQITLIASAGLLSAAAAFYSTRGTAAGAADPLLVAKSIESGVGIYGDPGETPAMMQKENALHVEAYEDEATEGGGGADQKTLIDNNKVKVILVAYKRGFVRAGGMKRRHDTALIYVTPGRYTITKVLNGMPVKMAEHKLAPGSVVFHRKDSIVSEVHVDEPYRVLYVEMK